MDHSGNSVDYRDKRTAGGPGDQRRMNLATIQLILALEAVIEESTQRKIGLNQEAVSRNIYWTEEINQDMKWMLVDLQSALIQITGVTEGEKKMNN